MPARTILVVDDEEAVRSCIRGILAREGFSLIEAVDGADALRQVEQRGAVDLLVTDIRMPGMDGLALARAVNLSYPRTPVLYISAYPLGQLERSCEASGECAFLVKPFTRRALLDAVRHCLRPSGAVGGGAA